MAHSLVHSQSNDNQSKRKKMNGNCGLRQRKRQKIGVWTGSDSICVMFYNFLPLEYDNCFVLFLICGDGNSSHASRTSYIGCDEVAPLPLRPYMTNNVAKDNKPMQIIVLFFWHSRLDSMFVVCTTTRKCRARGSSVKTLDSTYECPVCAYSANIMLIDCLYAFGFISIINAIQGFFCFVNADNVLFCIINAEITLTSTTIADLRPFGVTVQDILSHQCF